MDEPNSKVSQYNKNHDRPGDETRSGGNPEIFLKFDILILNRKLTAAFFKTRITRRKFKRCS